MKKALLLFPVAAPRDISNITNWCMILENRIIRFTYTTIVGKEIQDEFGNPIHKWGMSINLMIMWKT